MLFLDIIQKKFRAAYFNLCLLSMSSGNNIWIFTQYLDKKSYPEILFDTSLRNDINLEE